MVVCKTVSHTSIKIVPSSKLAIFLGEGNTAIAAVLNNYVMSISFLNICV